MKKILLIIKKYKKPIIISLVILLVIFVSYVVWVNIVYKSYYKYTEVTFVAPDEAIIFWKGKNEKLGYIKYSEKRFGKKEIELQTSSVPSETHIVYLQNISLEGEYITMLEESRNIFVIPQTIKIQYSGNNEGE